MQDRLGVDQKDLSGLIALVRETQGKIEAHGEVNELNVILLDFARELLKRRVLARVEFVRLMKSPGPG